MAVRHGYGKIAGADALVFAYDTGDTYNSYKGEPTVNVHPYALDIYAQGTGGNQISLSRDTSITSPVKGISMKMVPLGNDPYIATYSNSNFNLAAAASGQTWTASAYVKGNRTMNAQIFVFEANSSGAYLTHSARTITIGTEWTRISVTRTFNNASTAYVQARLDGPDTYNSGDILWWDGYQVEQNSHPTPFVNGTRSATQGLLDLTGNRSIDLGNVNFDSNAQKIFDGTDDTIEITTATEIIDSDYTVETVVKKDTNGVQEGILSDYQYAWWIFKITSANKAYIVHKWNNSTPVAVTGATTIGTDYTHITVTFSKTDGMKLYVNGELDGTNSSTLPFVLAGRGPRYIGHLREGAPGSPASFFNGQIPVLKISTGALTANEVRNNFNFYKGRFGI